ncbi:MAG TPA: hypothetical protein VFW29_03765 [Solirubrobacteraceae bacterium]|nr:hypothetical protein [Solirubrobacteraceae bacterium]
MDATPMDPILPATSSACAAGEPCRFAYQTLTSAIEGTASNGVHDAYVAQREPSGWRVEPWSGPTPPAGATGTGIQQFDFSPDLNSAVLRVYGALTPGAQGGVLNLYRREADGSLALLTSSPPAETTQCSGCWEFEDVPTFSGQSEDGRRVLFEANDSLLAGAPGGGVENLYEAGDGGDSLVGILPDGSVPAKGARAGGGAPPLSEQLGQNVRRAMSADGSRVVFQAKADGGVPAPQQNGFTQVYDRISGRETVELSAPVPGARPGECETEQGICDAAAARFWAASEDGTLVLFTSKEALTKASFVGAEERTAEELEEEELELLEEEELEEEGIAKVRENPGDDLYVYDLATRSLTDLTVDAGNPSDSSGADVLGVAGASADGSYVYFVADGDLARGAVSGRPNLYLWHGAPGSSTTTFIATLSAPDEREEELIAGDAEGSEETFHSDVADWTSFTKHLNAYVTPDGHHLAFTSVEPLTGFDNRDASTGLRDAEVYEFSTDDGRLVCASCDPSGTQPEGSAFVGARATFYAGTAFYQQRTLSDDGSRVFFSSPDALAPEVVAGHPHVFEYEAGSIHLLSGGGSGETALLDASPSGDDVFIATREPLAPNDADDLIDIYDARVGGGIAGAPRGMAGCEAAGCRPPAGGQLPLPALASEGSAPSGNLLASPTSPPRRLTARQRLSRALAQCARLKPRARRARCVAAAKRRYAPKAKRHARSRRPSTAHRGAGR